MTKYIETVPEQNDTMKISDIKTTCTAKILEGSPSSIERWEDCKTLNIFEHN